jgi:ubiquinone/menaquinone biosynthesis C-methylase UbiE
MMHVGMNIEDKDGLFAEIYRVLRPGAAFGVYDVMRQKDGGLAYPVPWAAQTTAPVN